MGGAPTPKHAAPNHVSPWRYLPQVVVVTMVTVVLPLVLVEVAQSLAGIRSVALAIPLAIALSVVAATIGSSLWKRRPGARDMLFGDLMLVGFARLDRAQSGPGPPHRRRCPQLAGTGRPGPAP